MQERVWFGFQPDRAVREAVLVAVGGIVAVAGGLWLVPPQWRGGLVSVAYSVWVGLVLAHAYRVSSLAEVGLTRRGLLPGTAAAVAVALLGVAGTLQDPTMAGATLHLPGGLTLAAMLVTTFAAAFAEQLLFAGYLQLRVEVAFGRLAGVLAYSALFTGFHVALVWLPGAVPPSGNGMAQFALGIFVASSLVALLFTYCRNVWALTLAGGLNALLYNLYLLSLRPEEVLVADPGALVSGVPLLLGWLAAVWMTGRMIRKRVPPWLRMPIRPYSDTQR